MKNFLFAFALLSLSAVSLNASTNPDTTSESVQEIIVEEAILASPCEALGDAVTAYLTAGGVDEDTAATFGGAVSLACSIMM